MKELSIEQKARAYDDAIKRAKELLEIGVKDTRDKRVVLSFFPELKESEDERIRKAIIECVKNYGPSSANPKLFKNMLAWLEKQGEQKPTWSEDDGNRINRLIAYFEGRESFTAEDDVVYANWLKSLKERYTWKPSDEQINAIGMAITFVTDDFSDNPTLSEILKDLQNQLKAL